MGSFIFGISSAIVVGLLNSFIAGLIASLLLTVVGALLLNEFIDEDVIARLERLELIEKIDDEYRFKIELFLRWYLNE